MSIPLRTEEEIVKLREACKLASDVLVMIEPYVKAVSYTHLTLPTKA